MCCKLLWTNTICTPGLELVIKELLFTLLQANVKFKCRGKKSQGFDHASGMFCLC